MRRTRNREPGSSRGLAAIAAMLLLLALIGGGWLLHRRKTVLNLGQLAGFLLSSSVYSEGMRTLEGEEVFSRYPGITDGDVADFRIYAAQDGTAREFALFQAKDKETADDIMTSLSLYCHAREELFALADPQEAARIRGYRIRRSRDYVLLLISDPQGSGGQMLADFSRIYGYDFIN